MAQWPALSSAVANNWGGPNSADKRDWFVGAVSELFDNDTCANPENLEIEQLDVEDRLLQIMQDEFDVNLEDESEIMVAEDIMRLRKQVMERGDLSMVEELRMRHEKKGGAIAKGMVEQKNGSNDSDDDDDDDDASTDDASQDVDMTDAPQLVAQRAPRQAPVIDDDGFETVVSRKRR